MIAKARGLAKGIVGALAITLLAGPALAGDGSMKDGPAPSGRTFAWAASFAVGSDYIFRGQSQTAEDPTIQATVDLTYGILYGSVFMSNLDFGETMAGRDVANMELTFSGGIKPVLGPVTFDFGVIYYTYPGAKDPGAELNFFEAKAGASISPWKGGTVGLTGYYSPEYTGELGEVWTLEGSLAQELPKIHSITPTFSALVGFQWGDDPLYEAAFGDDNYVYWNAGVTFAFTDRFSIDVRYWDTNIDAACTNSRYFSCDERVVGTAKVTF